VLRPPSALSGAAYWLHDTPEQADFRVQARQWLAVTLAEVCGDVSSPDYDLRLEEYPVRRRWQAALADAGWAGLAWPVEYGGRAFPMALQAVFHEESSRARAPRPLNSIGLYMAGPTIIAFGTEMQKADHLGPILRGDEIWCQGFSEPGAGSDLRGLRVRAQPDGDGYTINGTKIWTSYADVSSYCILLARTSVTAGEASPLSMLLLPMDAPGVTCRPIRQATGKARFCEVVLENVRLPRSALLGAEGQGWQVAMTTIAHERATMGFALQADCAALLDRLTDLAREAGVTGGEIGARLATMRATTSAMRALGRIGLRAYSETGTPGPEGSMMKLTWEQLQHDICVCALELLGTPGGRRVDERRHEYWTATYLRSRGNTIEAGTTEMHLNAISQRILGMPRPPRVMER
jgi:alkylation response protein AidB-like acyl-CoA dehydrogenase